MGFLVSGVAHLLAGSDHCLYSSQRASRRGVIAPDCLILMKVASQTLPVTYLPRQQNVAGQVPGPEPREGRGSAYTLPNFGSVAVYQSVQAFSDDEARLAQRLDLYV